MTDLFLSNVDRLGQAQINALDDVLVRLFERTEAEVPGTTQRSAVYNRAGAARDRSQACVSQRPGGGGADPEKLEPTVGEGPDRNRRKRSASDICWQSAGERPSAKR